MKREKWYEIIMWLSIGVLVGVIITCVGFYASLHGLLDTTPIQHLTINLNETQIVNALVEHMNATGQ